MNGNRDKLNAVTDAILKRLNKDELEKIGKDYDVPNTLIILVVLSGVCFILSISNTDPDDWLTKWKFTFFIFSIIFSMLWLGISIERLSFFKTLWSFGVVKLVISLSISALLLFCTARSSLLINSVFGIDSSTFPFTRSFLSFFLFLKYLSPFLFLFIIISVFHVFNIIGYFKNNDNYESFPASSFCFIVFSAMVAGFFSLCLYKYFSEEKLLAKTYVLARSLDFNEENHCLNLKNKKVGVVFIGSSQDKILIDENEIQVNNLENFFKNESVNFNSSNGFKFKVERCILDTSGSVLDK